MRNLAGTGVDLRQGDLATAFDDLLGTVDVVVCNPPYIPLEAWESVAAEARDHDPHLALFSGAGRARRDPRARAACGGPAASPGEWWASSTPTCRASRRRPCSPPPVGGARCATTRTWPGVRAGPPPGWHYERHGRVCPPSTDDERETALEAATLAVRRGQLVVLPTDTVYGVGADAFDPDAVAGLLEAKGRGRDMPPPVLISQAATADALALALPGYARTLMENFWPGPLTIVGKQQPSLQWDLGDTRGTVAIRMPDHPVALELLERTGPLAVTSANLTGQPAATDAEQAEEMLGDTVEVIIDAGPSPQGADSAPSTIIDVTGPQGRVLRIGALSLEQLNEVLEPTGATILDEG